MVEEYKAIFGKRLGNYWVGFGNFYSTGTPCRVGFDFEAVENNIDNLIGFWHTHPGMSPYPSATDITTMYGWINMVGRPLLCFIERPKDEVSLKNTKCHVFYDDERMHTTISGNRVGNFFWAVNNGKQHIPSRINLSRSKGS